MTNKYYKKLILGLMVMAFLVLAGFQSVVKVEAKIKDGNYYEYYSGMKDSSGIYKMRLKKKELVIWGSLMQIDSKTGKVLENLKYKKRSVSIAKNMEIYSIDEGQQYPITKKQFKKQCKKGYGGCFINIKIENGKVVSIGIS